ncbi:MAG: Na/Pi cotransporter family protein [Chitinophagales bacterium]
MGWWLGGGLGAFLGGLWLLRGGLAALGAGTAQRSLLHYGDNPALAWLVGAGFAALLHSSGLVTVSVVGLVQGGFLGFKGAIGAVLGANVGTTATAQLMGFSSAAAGWAALGGGALLWLAGEAAGSRRAWLRSAGSALGGCGLVFLGLEWVGRAFAGDVPGWGTAWMARSAGRPVAGVLAGAALTALVQSSTVFIGVVMKLAAEGGIGLLGAVHLVLGGNIGSCLPSVVAGVLAGRAGRWAGLVNLIFNVAGVAAVLPFLPRLEGWLAASAGGAARQVANAHGLFNLVTAVAALPLAWPIGNWLERQVRSHAPGHPGGARPPGRMDGRRAVRRALDLFRR